MPHRTGEVGHHQSHILERQREPYQLKHSDEGQVKEGQRHGPASSFRIDLQKSSWHCPDDIFGTHTVGFPNSRDLYVLPLTISGPAPVVGAAK